MQLTTLVSTLAITNLLVNIVALVGGAPNQATTQISPAQEGDKKSQIHDLDHQLKSSKIDSLTRKQVEQINQLDDLKDKLRAEYERIGRDHEITVQRGTSDEGEQASGKSWPASFGAQNQDGLENQPLSSAQQTDLLAAQSQEKAQKPISQAETKQPQQQQQQNIHNQIPPNGAVIGLQQQQPIVQTQTQQIQPQPQMMLMDVQQPQPINLIQYNHHQQQIPQHPIEAPQPLPPRPALTRIQQVPLPVSYQPSAPVSTGYHHSSIPQLYFGHNPFIEILRPLSYADDNIVTLNLSHSHIYEIDSDAFVGQRFEHIDLSNNKLGLIHSKSFRIGPNHSKHNPQFNPHHNPLSAAGSGNNNNNTNGQKYSNNLPVAFGSRRPPPSNPKSVIIDFSHNTAIVALSGAFDHIDVPNCLLNFTNSTVELKFGAFKKYFKEHPGHIVEIDSVDCCEQEWLLGYKHNFVSRTHCEHDPSLLLTKAPHQSIVDSCIAYVATARHSMTIQGPSIIHQVGAGPRTHSNSHQDNQYLTYLILGGTAMILTSLSIYIIFYMFSLKAVFVYQMQHKS